MVAKVSWTLGLAACMLMACGDDDDDDSAAQGTCLSDAEICQFVVGVSTKDDIQKKLGNAQQYFGTESAIYICQQISGQQIVHNDLISFSYDANGRLEDITVLRQGSGATPPPACAQ
jgi:outer membrane protein assembly factor BamE (lipoprotein component of BamABCDE complex)